MAVTTERVPDESRPPRSPPIPRDDAKVGSALVELTLVRFREFVREPEAVFWVFLFPLLLAAGLGIAFRNRPPERAHVAVADDAPVAAPSLAALAADSALVVEHFPTAAAAERALASGDVALVVVGASSTVEYRFDRTRPDARAAQLLADRAVQRGAGRRDAIAPVERYVSERGSRYIDFFIPGLLGMNLMGSGIWGVGFAIVTARTRKLLKRLVATPMSRAQYLLSFLISRLLFLVIEVGLLLGFAVLVFGVPVRASAGTLVLVILTSALCFSGLGLLIAARPKTIEGASGLMNFVMMPMWIFSGVFFSAANFPKAIQPAIRLLPLTAVNDALRATMLRGASLGAVLPELAVIVGWMVLSFAVALKIFRWR